MMRVFSYALATALALAVMAGSPARADNCLDRFHCQLYGPCPLPCLDQLMGALQPHPQEPPAAPPTADGELADAPRPPAATQRPKLSKTAQMAHKKEPRSERLAVVRVVAASGITSLDQLAGKPVSFGPEGDVSEVVGRKMFAKLGVKVAETPLTFDNAIDGVGTGDVAAVLVLHDRDVAKLKALSSRKLELLAMPAATEPPADMKATTLSPVTAGPLAHGRPLRAFAVAVTELPRLIRHMASATP